MIRQGGRGGCGKVGCDVGKVGSYMGVVGGEVGCYIGEVRGEVGCYVGEVGGDLGRPARGSELRPGRVFSSRMSLRCGAGVRRAPASRSGVGVGASGWVEWIESRCVTVVALLALRPSLYSTQSQ